ncbi:ATPase component BioM of energizing module of biotin ECF transporter [Microbacterium esteraromaticum]|uniref:ATPase component BioM of energizing module of biotin ECF transporter n=1 Tax=Microbacterium esteraromaticum TaxID=57043 RepID=A0A1R4IWK5_9MICO|nr:ABC transporter ATP-binding protein [Microbacterium esteraromaticum]SJN24267.1 ATPase component BioM of energizing module of biotin ECF transporter [Microbacterium esteraromaticum]
MRSESLSDSDSQPDAITLDDVRLEVDGAVLLRDVTLRLNSTRTAVIGANGSGKSTFGRLLNGLRSPTAGTIRVHGLDPVREASAVRRRVGFVFTNPETQILMPTPAEDLTLSLRDTPRAERPARVEALLAEYGLADKSDVPVSSLSGGQRQLLAIAAVLATEPALVVADEPTTLLDLRNARRIGDLLLSLGVPLVLITHDLELAARCDEAVLFEDGGVRAVGAPDAVIDEYRRSLA